MNYRRTTDRRWRGGFTLLELIVVITIIGILATLVVVNTSGVGPKARRAKADSDMDTIIRVASGMYNETGRYPESIEEMVNATDDNGMPLMMTLDKFPKDPWQNEYIYEITDSGPTVICLGSDGEVGGEKEAMDIQKPEAVDSSY